MTRRFCLVALTAGALLLPFASVPRGAGQIRLARQPDYHAGRIAFTYLGDIWTASETGANPDRITDHRGHDMSPKFSPDGKWIAFTSNRYGNNDVFVVPSTGGSATRLTFHPGGDDVVGWTRDSTKVLIRAARNVGAFPNVATLWEVPVGGGPEVPLPVDWGAYGSYSPDGRSLAFNRHPSSWTRQHYRSIASADLWVVNLAAKTFTQLLPNERYNRMWPMWGTDNMIYFVGDPLANDRSVIPGSPEVRKSANNIYKIPASGSGQPVQVTHHPDGNLFWPSMSSDGKVIVYESMFGVWKLDLASGKSSEIRIEVSTDDKDNETDMEVVRNDVDSFDLSPSGRRAAISARGQLLTIATERGDVTRIAPDPMSSRNQFPKWSPDGKSIAYLSDKSGRDEIWISDPDGNAPKKITNLDNEKGAIVWTPDSTALLYTAADKRLYRYTVADDKTLTLSSSDVNRIGGVSVSPDSKWVALAKQDRTLRSHVFVVPLAGGEERHISDDRVHYSEANAVWTADGRYLVFTESEGFSNGIATQGGIATTMTLWVLPLRDQERDPTDRDIDNEAEGLAAEAAARQAGGGRGGAAAPPAPPTVQIDWNNIARRARRLTVPGTTLGRLTPAPEGHAIALSVGAGGGPGGGRGGAGDSGAGLYVIDVETGQLTRLPSAPPSNVQAGRGGGGGGFQAGGAGSGIAFTRDSRTIYFTSGNGLYAAPVNLNALRETAAAPSGGRGGRGGGAPQADAPAPAAGGAGGGTARQVTYTANIEIDRKALRSQVFNEGWRIMKNRFYDAKMHGANWPALREMYEQLLPNVGNTEELHNVIMMMIGHLNASHTGVSGGPNPITSNVAPRYPGFDVVSDPSGFYKVGHIYKAGPADHDYLKIAPGQFIISVDRRPLKTTDNYWRALQTASGTKFHFMVNDKPTAQGAWEVSITPANGGEWSDLQYAKWVDDRREMVTKLSDGNIGYLHIRAMDAPSLRQFQLDLAANRTKQALVIDQRFNGGGGIDQELLMILSGRKYQYTIGRDAGFEQPRPQNFYGPMVVMQNERSGSDAEMFPAGFKALGLGKVVGVHTAAAVIGTGSYTLLDGSAIRTPGTGVWTATGQNMENYGVPPDVYIDNTPADFLQGRDAQIEKAVEVLKADLATRKTSTQQ